MVYSIGEFSGNNDIYYKQAQQNALRMAQWYQSQIANVPQQVQAQQLQESIFQSQVQQPTRGNACTDGKDDGKISFWSKIGHVLKGGAKFVTGMFTDENGNFSLKQTAKTIAMGAVIGLATCIPVIGPLVIPALTAYGMIDGGLKVVNGLSTAMDATTDAEAKAAWEKVGNGATEGTLSYIGYKKSGGFKEAFDKSAAQFNAKFSKTSAETPAPKPAETPAPKPAETPAPKPAETTMKPTAEAQARYNAVQEQLSKPTEIDASTIDKQFGNYKPNEQLSQLNECYRQLETFQQTEKTLATQKTQTVAPESTTTTNVETLQQTSTPQQVTADPFADIRGNKLKTSGDTQVSQHHSIDGCNHNYRQAVKAQKNGTLETDWLSSYYKRCLEDMAKVDNEFSSLPPTECDIVTYRGVQDSFRAPLHNWFVEQTKVKVGDVIVPDEGYMYTSPNQCTANKFLSACEDFGNIYYEIKIPKGAQVSRNMEHSGEVLMPRGAQYKVLAVEGQGTPRMNISLEYILPNK